MTDRRQSHQHDLSRGDDGLKITRSLPNGNGDEHRYRFVDGRLCYLGSFTKSLRHDDNGFVINPQEYAAWVQRVGAAAELEPRLERCGRSGAGCRRAPDSIEYLPPSPSLDSQELIAEMGELYWMALCRDVPFSNWSGNALIDEARESLGRLWWFREDCTARLVGITDSLPESQARRRLLSMANAAPIPLAKLFRGVSPGEDRGPYLSQFLLIGNTDSVTSRPVGEGIIAYGAICMNQRVGVAPAGRDYLQCWSEWLKVQNGADLRGRESYSTGYRFIATPRDLATYVHRDTLYEAYLNAALILLGLGAPFDPGLPAQLASGQYQQSGFAQFGGPHMLALVTEAAGRTQKAVRYQKFNVHRRARPEALGGWLYQRRRGRGAVVERLAALSLMEGAFAGRTGIGEKVSRCNGLPDNWLLPQAYSEGSPNHPSYGASYAAVAGACATILKAWFDSSWTLRHGQNPIAFEPMEDGSALRDISDSLSEPLTVEGEINKLAANIAQGRSWAGVHYYSDCFESLRLGERIALNLLKEQKLVYGESFSPTVPLFDGSQVTI